MFFLFFTFFSPIPSWVFMFQVFIVPPFLSFDICVIQCREYIFIEEAETGLGRYANCVRFSHED